MIDNSHGSLATLEGGNHGEKVWPICVGSVTRAEVTIKELAASRTAPLREVQRAKILLGYSSGTSITDLQRQLGFGRPMI